MAIPPEKLAQSLEILRSLQTAEGAGAIRARDLSRTHRERLLREGFLQEVIKGWYIPSRPDEAKGDSTAWYASFWRFCAAYLEARFGARWCLSPEQSLSLHAGNWTVPGQLAARSPRAGNKVTKLPHRTSLLELRLALPGVADRKEEAGLRLFSVESALIACSPNYFSNNATDVRTVLPMIRNASGLLARLLEGGHTVIAGRLAGAFRNIGLDRIADDIVKTMAAADYAVRENDPFTDKPSLVIGARETSPYVNRLRLLWQKMREPVIERFPKAPGPPRNIDAYLKRVNDAYLTDAYHSLSIEGYRVTPALIERVRSGTWNPEADEGDREQRNAMAARGYWQAFQAVQKSLGKILKGENPGEVADADDGTWYRELFAPSVTVGLLKPADLAGLPQRPGLYPQVDARAAEPGRGEGRHAGVLRPSTRRATFGRPRGSRALHLRLHPSLYGWERPRRAVPDEHHDGVGRIPVDGHSRNRPQRLRERPRKSECRRGYCAPSRTSSPAW